MIKFQFKNAVLNNYRSIDTISLATGSVRYAKKKHEVHLIMVSC